SWPQWQKKGEKFDLSLHPRSYDRFNAEVNSRLPISDQTYFHIAHHPKTFNPRNYPHSRHLVLNKSLLQGSQNHPIGQWYKTYLKHNTFNLLRYGKPKLLRL